MATLPLVGIRDDIAPLVKISLQHHQVPVTAVYDVLEVPYEKRFVAIATPLTEAKGTRDAYMKVFAALEDETFATKSFLRLNTLVLSAEELREIRRILKKGMSEANLPSLAHLRDVLVRPVEDAKDIQRGGMLHLVRNRDSSLLVTFGSFSTAGGAMKPRHLENDEDLDHLLVALRIRGNQVNEIKLDLQDAKHASIPVTCSLEALYTQGLI